MFCPFSDYFEGEPEHTEIFRRPCLEGECAWWVARSHECAIWVMAAALERLSIDIHSTAKEGDLRHLLFE